MRPAKQSRTREWWLVVVGLPCPKKMLLQVCWLATNWIRSLPLFVMYSKLHNILYLFVLIIDSRWFWHGSSTTPGCSHASARRHFSAHRRAQSHLLGAFSEERLDDQNHHANRHALSQVALSSSVNLGSCRNLTTLFPSNSDFSRINPIAAGTAC